MALLWQRLPENHPFKISIYQFLHQESSPVRYIQQRLRNVSLIEGSGEFGGGAFIPGCFCNVVQNNLAMLALKVVGDMETEIGDDLSAASYFQDAQKLRDNMESYLVDEEGSWIWCVDPVTLKPRAEIINHEINKGFGGLNGVACMFSDVLGLEPLASKWIGIDHSLKTFNKLYSAPLRREQFDRYGICPQCDVYRAGLSSGPSYGDGYALQTMLLFDKLDMADKSLTWLANSTYTPIAAYHVDRTSPYHFYERSYSPDAEGKLDLEQGCGALNLVNVAEPLKIARLILGVDATSLETVKIIPRIPPSWKGVEAINWPIRTSLGMVNASILCEKTINKTFLQITVLNGKKIPKLAVRLNDKWFTAQDVYNFEMSL